MKKLLSLTFVWALLAFAVCGQEDATPKKVEYPPGFSAKLDVEYTRVKDWSGRMDLYLPPKEKALAPVLINIHGGGWNHGTKESQTGFSTFFKMGFAVANVEYRLTPQATAPAAIEDVRCALLYLVKNSAELNIDADKIVIMGGSAGGHLALMAGLLQNDNRFDTNCPLKKQFKIVAIIDKYGLADLTTLLSGRSVREWLGVHAGDAKFVQSVSPINYVTKTSPPTFIVHGDADPTVPYQQSVELQKKFQLAGVKTVFITVPGGAHGKFTKEKNSELNRAIADFLKGLGLGAK
jgi:acetyl esterase/lipase